MTTHEFSSSATMLSFSSGERVGVRADVNRLLPDPNTECNHLVHDPAPLERGCPQPQQLGGLKPSRLRKLRFKAGTHIFLPASWFCCNSHNFAYFKNA